MKRILILLFILKLSVANAKIGIEGGLYGEYFRTNVSYNGGKFIFSGGAVAYIQLGKYVTLNYRFGGGNYSTEYAYIHCPASWALAGYCWNGYRNITKVGILFGIIPEGIGFYTRQDHSGIHINLNLLGFEYFHKRKDWEDFIDIRPDLICRYRFRKGSKFQMVSPYAGLTLNYIPRKKFPDFKVGLAITFESKQSGKKEKVRNDENENNNENKSTPE
ncbi:MAG: hypothetical protein ABIQ40_05615 [Bacteroidia bacterium]